MSYDARDKAEKVLSAIRSDGMGWGDEGSYLNGPVTADLISQALLEAHKAGREEMREEAAKVADRHKTSRRGEMTTYGIDLATAIRSIK